MASLKQRQIPSKVLNDGRQVFWNPNRNDPNPTLFQMDIDLSRRNKKPRLLLESERIPLRPHLFTCNQLPWASRKSLWSGQFSWPAFVKGAKIELVKSWSLERHCFFLFADAICPSRRHFSAPNSLQLSIHPPSLQPLWAWWYKLNWITAKLPVN